MTLVIVELRHHFSIRLGFRTFVKQVEQPARRPLREGDADESLVVRFHGRRNRTRLEYVGVGTHACGDKPPPAPAATPAEDKPTPAPASTQRRTSRRQRQRAPHRRQRQGEVPETGRQGHSRNSRAGPIRNSISPGRNSTRCGKSCAI